MLGTLLLCFIESLQQPCKVGVMMMQRRKQTQPMFVEGADGTHGGDVWDQILKPLQLTGTLKVIWSQPSAPPPAQGTDWWSTSPWPNPSVTDEGSHCFPEQTLSNSLLKH